MCGGKKGEDGRRKQGKNRGKDGGRKEGESKDPYPSVTWAAYLRGIKRDQVGRAAGQEVHWLPRYRCFSGRCVHCHQVIAAHESKE